MSLLGNKRMHNQGAQESMTDYERSKMLRVQENQERLRELGVKNIAKSLASLAVAENTKKRQIKAKVTNEKDVEYNPEDSVDSEENYQVATHVTAPKKLHRRQYIAPMSMNRYANLSKQRVSAPNISRVIPRADGEKTRKIVDANVEKRNQPRVGMTMGELILNKKGSLRKQSKLKHNLRQCNTLITSKSRPRRKLFSVDDDEWENTVRSQDVNEVDKEHDSTHNDENEEIENAIFKSIHNGLEGDDVRTLDLSEDEIPEDGLESDENDDNGHFIFENNQNEIEYGNDSEDGSENEDEDVELVEAQLDGPNMEKSAIPTSRKRGPTMMHAIHVRMSDARENINCNEYGQPVGPVTEEKDTVGKFSRFLGTIARTYSYAPWNKMWEYVLDKYVVPENAKSWVLKSIGACWRGYKCRIKKKHFYKYKDTRTRWKNRPKSIPQKEFAQLLTLWNKKEVMDRCLVLRNIRMSQKNMHTAGPKSFARIREDLSYTNKRTKRLEENMHIDFLEDQPNVTGSGPNWMFDLDFLTNTMNYIPVSVENQVNVDAGSQEHYVAGSSKKDKEPTQEYILLLLHPHRLRITVEDVVQAAQEKPSEDFPKDNDVQDSEDEKLLLKAYGDATRTMPFGRRKEEGSSGYSINKLNTVDHHLSILGTNTIDASTTPHGMYLLNPNMPDLEYDSNVFLNDDIFSGACDNEDMGAKADFNNMDNTIDVSPIPTLRVHKDHPKGQILGDPKSAVQTRG
ncbi:transposase, Ptta/En/Spm [Tanacetum coccineum]